MSITVNKNIIVVGPGTLPIPVPGSNGWGGIENTLTWALEEFDNRKQSYTLINDKDNFNELVKHVSKQGDSVIHLHYDDYAPVLFKERSCPLISTSHSPYHPYMNVWTGNIKNHFTTLFNSIDGYFGQATVSNNNALKLNPNLKIGLFRCGIPDYMFSSNRKQKGNKKSLVIGKIESRKNQAQIQHHFGNDLEIDFVGPISDSHFISNDFGKTRYLGTWSREDVVKKMTDYSSLILFSAFEGDVLVVKEALAAGCSVFVSEEASLNLDRSKPFIKILQNNDSKESIIETVKQLNEENEKYRSNIVEYFNDTFSIEKTIDEYISHLIKVYG